MPQTIMAMEMVTAMPEQAIKTKNRRRHPTKVMTIKFKPKTMNKHRTETEQEAREFKTKTRNRTKSKIKDKSMPKSTAVPWQISFRTF